MTAAIVSRLIRGLSVNTYAFGCLALISCIFFAPFSANAQTSRDGAEIGVTAALNPNATGTPPQAAPRLLEVGVNVFANERIATTEGGQAQMLFIDESAFTVGPNSEVVLDEFVFDPDTGRSPCLDSDKRRVPFRWRQDQ